MCWTVTRSPSRTRSLRRWRQRLPPAHAPVPPTIRAHLLEHVHRTTQEPLTRPCSTTCAQTLSPPPPPFGSTAPVCAWVALHSNHACAALAVGRGASVGPPPAAHHLATNPPTPTTPRTPLRRRDPRHLPLARRTSLPSCLPSRMRACSTSPTTRRIAPTVESRHAAHHPSPCRSASGWPRHRRRLLCRASTIRPQALLSRRVRPFDPSPRSRLRRLLTRGSASVVGRCYRPIPSTCCAASVCP